MRSGPRSVGGAEESITQRKQSGGNSLKMISGVENLITTPDPIYDSNGSGECGT